MLTWMLVVAVALLASYEVIALVQRRATTPTISEIIWHATAASPLVPLFFGLLMGHFFWQRVCGV